MNKLTSLTAALGLVALVGCQTAQVGEPTGDLQLDLTEAGVTGTYEAINGDIVVFESVEVDDGVVEITLQFHGMSLVATIDETGAADIDGFADDGRDTQMTEADRAVIQELSSAVYDFDANPADASLRFLEKFTSMWATMTDSMELDRLVLAEENRSYTSLCAYKNNWWYTTHDGPGSWLGGCGSSNWSDKSSYYGYLSAHSDAPCGDSTWFWNWSSWQACGFNHNTSMEYAYGGCFGQCGAGCGSPDYTVDCANHDSCVRNGDHSLLALSCADELTFTLDDVAFAPNC